MEDTVFKKIHEDGSETVIKHVKPAYIDEEGNLKEKEEYVTSVFISSSYLHITFTYNILPNTQFKNSHN